MKQIIKRYFKGAIGEKKIFLKNFIWDMISNCFSVTLIYLIWILFVKTCFILNISLLENKIDSLNKYAMFILIFWFCISTIFMLVNYVRLLISINRIMEKKINEEI